jgi:hypothetical protein
LGAVPAAVPQNFDVGKERQPIIKDTAVGAAVIMLKGKAPF